MQRDVDDAHPGIVRQVLQELVAGQHLEQPLQLRVRDGLTDDLRHLARFHAGFQCRDLVVQPVNERLGDGDRLVLRPRRRQPRHTRRLELAIDPVEMPHEAVDAAGMEVREPARALHGEQEIVEDGVAQFSGHQPASGSGSLPSDALIGLKRRTGRTAGMPCRPARPTHPPSEGQGPDYVCAWNILSAWCVSSVYSPMTCPLMLSPVFASRSL